MRRNTLGCRYSIGCVNGARWGTRTGLDNRARGYSISCQLQGHVGIQEMETVILANT